MQNDDPQAKGISQLSQWSKLCGHQHPTYWMNLLLEAGAPKCNHSNGEGKGYKWIGGDE